MKTFWIVVAAMLALAQSAFAQDTTQTLGGGGESCRARSDCKAGFKCINQVCTDEHAPASTTHSSSASTDEWMKFKIDDGDLHPFIGLAFAGGPVLGGLGGNGKFDTGNTQGAFLFALKGGLITGPHELSLELSPMTYFYYTNTGGPTFQFNAAYHYLLKLYENETVSVFYPIGVGAGLFTGNTGNDVYFQARLDLIGVLFKIGHILVDLSFPSFRYGVTSANILGTTVNVDLFTWLFGASLGYAF